MDGFDDLLTHPKTALEENPFEDPFSGPRSNSPDPWASFSHQPSDPYAFNDVHSETVHVTASSADEQLQSNSEPVTISAAEGPLDLATQHSEDDKQTGPELIPSKSPGFKESSSTFDEIASIRPTITEDFEPPSGITSPTSLKQHNDRVESSGSPAPQDNKSGRIVVSPLEQSSSASDRSFPSLALGGEFPGGWQPSQGSWVNDAPPPSASRTSDVDDDEPIANLQKSGQEAKKAAAAQNASTPQRDSQTVALFSITVDDPQKVGDPIRGFTMYTVHTKTNSPTFSKSSFSVLRRYSDFLWLYETLSQNNPGVVVPPTPEKNAFGRFSDQFVQQRRLALEKCIQKIANHPVLCKDPDLKFFLESDTFALDIKHRKAEIAHERGGLMASIGQTIAGPRFHETDDWFDKQKAYLDSMENQLRALVKTIEIVARHRAELAAGAGEFAQSVSDLSASDVGKQISQSLASLAEVERKVQELQSAQAQQDLVTLMSTADEYARLINSVRLAFHGRIRTYHAWQNAENNLKRVKQAHEAAKSQGRPILGHSLNQIAEAERRALEQKHEFEHVSKLVKSEVARFERERIEDFKDALQTFLEGMITRQKTLIAAWEKHQQQLLRKGDSEGPQSPSQSSNVLQS